MATIALVTYSKLKNLSESDRLLKKSLEKFGYDIGAVSWDAPVDWTTFDCVILRSCWDYHTRYDEFSTWLSMLEKNNIVVYNPIPIVRWNSQKTYLDDLQKKGIAIIPTVWVRKNETMDLQRIVDEHKWSEIIIKPTIGASSYQVAVIDRKNMQHGQDRLDEILGKTDAMIQPFVSEVASEGELSLMFIGGSYSHTVLKRANPHDFAASGYRPKETLVTPSESVVREATRIYKSISPPPLYARVDGVEANGTFMLMELELIEPHLFMDLCPSAAQAFAQAVQKIIPLHSL